MRRLIVRRTHSLRKQEQLLESMMEMTDDGGAAGAAAAARNAPSQQKQSTPTPTPPTPSPAPPPPRARMPLPCRTLAILAAAYGLYVLAAFFGTALAGVVAASVSHPPVAAAIVGLWLFSELCFYLFFWRPRYLSLIHISQGIVR